MLTAVYQMDKQTGDKVLCAVFLMRHEAEMYLKEIDNPNSDTYTHGIKDIDCWSDWSNLREEI